MRLIAQLTWWQNLYKPPLSARPYMVGDRKRKHAILDTACATATCPQNMHQNMSICTLIIVCTVVISYEKLWVSGTNSSYGKYTQRRILKHETTRHVCRNQQEKHSKTAFQKQPRKTRYKRSNSTQYTIASNDKFSTYRLKKMGWLRTWNLQNKTSCVFCAYPQSCESTNWTS